MRVEPFRRFTQKACAAFTTGRPKKRPMNILLTGFGPFPGAPFNPTGRAGAKSWPAAATSHPAACGAQRTSSAPAMRQSTANCRRCWRATKPDVLVMFGLAGRTRHVRIETRARNAISRVGSGCGGTQAARWYNRSGRAGDTGDARAGAAAAQGGAIGGREGRPLPRRRPLSLQLSVLARDRGSRRSPNGPRSPPSCMCPNGPRGARRTPRTVNLRPAVRAGRSHRACGNRRRASACVNPIYVSHGQGFRAPRLRPMASVAMCHRARVASEARVMTMDRRRFLAFWEPPPRSRLAGGRGASPIGALGVDGAQFGLRPGSTDDQSQAFQRAIDETARNRAPLAIAPGSYRVGNLRLPSQRADRRRARRDQAHPERQRIAHQRDRRGERHAVGPRRSTASAAACPSGAASCISRTSAASRSPIAKSSAPAAPPSPAPRSTARSSTRS